MSPSLYDGTIAWEGLGGVYYWNGTSITELRSIYGNAAQGQFVSLYKGTIAWANFNYNPGIYYWDGSSVKQVSTKETQYFDYFPSLHDGIIAWQRHDGNDWEIFYSVIRRNAMPWLLLLLGD